MMDTELGILIRTVVAGIGLIVLAYIMGDYHTQVKEYLKKKGKTKSKNKQQRMINANTIN